MRTSVLKTFLTVNHLESILPFILYKPASARQSYRRISGFINKGYVIPYHHRPTCVTCGHYYLPYHYKDFKCSECRKDTKKIQMESLSPSDMKDLGIPISEALQQLGLPQTEKIEEWFYSYDDDNVSDSIKRLKKILGEK